MATLTQVTVVDDRDETTANVSTVQFAVEGVEYEIDLAPHNLAMLHAPFTTAGRRQPANRRARGAKPRTNNKTRGGAADDGTPAAVRRWWPPTRKQVPTCRSIGPTGPSRSRCTRRTAAPADTASTPRRPPAAIAQVGRRPSLTNRPPR